MTFGLRRRIDECGKGEHGHCGSRIETWIPAITLGADFCVDQARRRRGQGLLFDLAPHWGAYAMPSNMSAESATDSRIGLPRGCFRR
jgi:hypothetical protein